MKLLTTMTIGIATVLTQLAMPPLLAQMGPRGPYNPGNYYNYGPGNFNRGDFYNRGPRENHSGFDNWSRDGLNQQDYKREIQNLTQAIHKNPNFVDAYNNRALARFVLGDTPGAIADLQQAAKLYLQRGDKARYQQTLLSINELQRR